MMKLPMAMLEKILLKMDVGKIYLKAALAPTQLKH